MFYVFVVGTAGSGKSTLVDSFASWLQDHELDVATVNLDPAALWLPYGPDVDVRDYVNVEEVMRKYNLGPNGALIACADMIAAHVERLKEEINDLNPEYVLVDTPGQMELYAFRSAGPYITSQLAGERSAVLFLIDSVFAERPSGLVSALLLASSVNYRLLKPQLNVLSKVDLLSQESREKLYQWLENPLDLMEALDRDLSGMSREMNQRLCEVLREVGASMNLLPVSSKTGEGLDELFAELQRVFAGGGEEYVGDMEDVGV
ncbi:MAG: GTPase [Thermoprotei archaeon]|nr:MAG: GTPase [Thermoprotei archaeon]